MGSLTVLEPFRLVGQVFVSSRRTDRKGERKKARCGLELESKQLKLWRLLYESKSTLLQPLDLKDYIHSTHVQFLSRNSTSITCVCYQDNNYANPHSG